MVKLVLASLRPRLALVALLAVAAPLVLDGRPPDTPLIAAKPAVAVFPQALEAPAISGDKRAGGTVACSRGMWNDNPTRRYPVSWRWQRDGVDIPGETTRRHTVALGDLGHQLGCVVTATSEDGSGQASTSITPVPRLRTDPVLSGSPHVGDTLACSRGGWDERADTPYPITYRWLRDGQPVAGRTAPDYLVARADLGHGVLCEVLAAGAMYGFSQTASVYPLSLQRPSLSGDQRVGGTLTCGRGTWDDPVGDPYAVTHAWFRGGVAIFGATRSTYVVTLADLGQQLRCAVTAERLVEATSDVVNVSPHLRSLPVLEGDPRLGGTLSCSRGVWDERPGTPLYDTAYRWIRNGAPLDSETTPSFAITHQDLGRTVLCRVTVAGMASADTAAVSPRPVVRIPPSISGDPRLGGTLTCTRGSWDERADAPYAVAYQWYRDGQPTGAPAATHVVAGEDLNHQLSCIVTAETLTSANAPPLFPTVEGRLPPQVSGEPYVGQTLTCSRGSWDERADHPFAISYRWIRNGSPIAGATSTTYVVVASDEGTSIGCDATAEGLRTQTAQPISIRAAVPPPVGVPVNLVPPVVTGDPRLGRTLSCSRGHWDDTPGARYPVTIEWYREYPFATPTPSPIATGSDHVVAQDDLTRTLYCVATTGGSVAYTGIDVNGPVALDEPEIVGDTRVRRTLTCTRGTWDDDDQPYTVTFRWYREHPFAFPPPDPIDTGSTHVVTVEDTGRHLYCEARAAGLSPVLASRFVPAPLNVVEPEISGDTRVGGTLTCSRGTWDDEADDRYAVTYTWLREHPSSTPAPPPIDSGPTHEVELDDLGHQLYCLVSAETTGLAIAAISVQPPHAETIPQVTGSPRLGKLLTCERGIWDDPDTAPYPITFTWLRDWPFSSSTTELGTGPTHTVTAADLGHTLYCRAEAPGGGVAYGSVDVPGPRLLSGLGVDRDPRPGIPVTCLRGTWDDEPAARYPVAYAWYRDVRDDEHRVATTAAYTPVAADVGHTLQCTVTAAELTMHTVFTGVRLPEVRTPPAIVGEARLGERLACTRGDWDDEDEARYPVAYAWYRDLGSGDPDPEAHRISSTNHHVVVPEDVNRSLVCTVTAAAAASASAFAFPQDAQPVLTADVDDDQPLPSGAVTVTLRLSNPGVTPVTLHSLRDRAFPGAAYRPGSSAGVTGVDPSDDGEDLTWFLSRVVLPGEVVEQRYTVDLAPGTDDLVDRPGAFADRPVLVARRARVSPEPEPLPASCTVLGTPGADVLVGTAGPDTICGLGGDDVLRGLGGDDVLWGGAGSDRLDGGEDDDALHGGRDDDTLIGGIGADLIHGGGGSGDLVTYADRDAPVLVSLGDGANDGGAGEADEVRRDVERIRGGVADDVLVGSDDANAIAGLGGDDMLVGLGGVDDLVGGAGDDHVEAQDANVELIDCGGGADVVVRDLTDRIVGCELDA